MITPFSYDPPLPAVLSEAPRVLSSQMSMPSPALPSSETYYVVFKLKVRGGKALEQTLSRHRRRESLAGAILVAPTLVHHHHGPSARQ